MELVYLDWNVLNKIEKMDSFSEDEREIYLKIKKLILEGKIVVPYSNAHINDLKRGYKKNPEFTQEHLQTIRNLTNNLCIVQYWGQDEISIHYRDIDEFFYSSIEDSIDLFSDPEYELAIEPLKNIPFVTNKNHPTLNDPIIKLIYPTAIRDNTMYALMKDILDLFSNVQQDYALYNSIRKYLQANRHLANTHKDMFNQIESSSIAVPNNLVFDESWDEIIKRNNTSKNEDYNKILNTYFKIDFRGVKSDDKFANMIDDALHVFYGAHCRYFITLDDKCHYKANETYKMLSINTEAYKPKDFVEAFNA